MTIRTEEKEKEKEKEKQREVAVYVAETANDIQRTALLSWTQGLLRIRDLDLNRRQKLVAAASLTKQHKVMWPIAKVISAKLKEVIWDNRSKRMRIGIGTGAAAFAIFGSQGAGIAALGTAIGVPLWFVFGAGASFACMLVEELQAKHTNSTTYTIDAEKDETASEKLPFTSK